MRDNMLCVVCHITQTNVMFLEFEFLLFSSLANINNRTKITCYDSLIIADSNLYRQIYKMIIVRIIYECK